MAINHWSYNENISIVICLAFYRSLVLIIYHDLSALLTVSLLKAMKPLHSLKAGWFVKRSLGGLWFDP